MKKLADDGKDKLVVGRCSLAGERYKDLKKLPRDLDGLKRLINVEYEGLTFIYILHFTILHSQTWGFEKVGMPQYVVF